MKKASILFLSMIMVSVFTFAQAPQRKTIDLGVNLLSPKDSLPNMQIGDTVAFIWEVINRGPDDYNSADGDVMYLYMATNFFGSDAQAASPYVRFGVPDSFFVGAGTRDTLYLYEAQGTALFLNNTGEINYPDDSKTCFNFCIMGGTSYANGDSILYFNDRGFDGLAFNQWNSGANPGVDGLMSAFSANNVSGTTVYFGNGQKDLCATGITNKTADNGLSLKVYPNPTHNQVRLTLTARQAASLKLNILDLTGRHLIEKDLGQINPGKNHFSVDVSSLTDGFYILEVSNDLGQKTVTKFIKK